MSVQHQCVSIKIGKRASESWRRNGRGGAEKLRGKNRQALQTDAAKCCKITLMLSVAAGSSSAAMADESGDAGGTGSTGDEDKERI